MLEWSKWLGKILSLVLVQGEVFAVDPHKRYHVDFLNTNLYGNGSVDTSIKHPPDIKSKVRKMTCRSISCQIISEIDYNKLNSTVSGSRSASSCVHFDTMNWSDIIARNENRLRQKIIRTAVVSALRYATR